MHEIAFNTLELDITMYKNKVKNPIDRKVRCRCFDLNVVSVVNAFNSSRPIPIGMKLKRSVVFDRCGY